MMQGHKAAEWQELVIVDNRIAEMKDIAVRSIADLRTGPKRLVDRLFFDGLDVLRCYEGRFLFSFQGCPSIELNSGEMLVIYPRHTVTIDAIGKSNRMLYGIFEGSDVENYFDRLGFFDRAKGRTEAHYESIIEIQKQLDKCAKLQGGAEDYCLSFLTDILLTQAGEMRQNGNAFVFDVINAIYRNLRQGLSQEKYLCSQLNISRMQLGRVFAKAGLGLPSEYIRSCQICMIRDLLKNTKKNFNEIAKQTGFLSASHFTTFVKRMTGLTPTQIRQGEGI